MPTEIDTDELPLVEGAIAGGGAWVAGYVLTALVVVLRFGDSELGELSDRSGDAGSLFEFVGWVFFNGHFVDTLLEAGFLGVGGTVAQTFVGGDGFTPILYAVPPALLIGAGLAVARGGAIAGTTEGVVAGLTVVPVYLSLSAAGAFLFRVSAEGLGVSFNGRPELLPAVVLAGVIFPAVFGAIGGVIGAATADS